MPWGYGLVGMTVVHLLLGATLGLSVDEAHYALYARYLDWSYFDHPPLVGWAQWPFVAMSAPIAVLRLLPVGLWLLTVVLVCRITERLQVLRGEPLGHAATWASVSLALAPILHILGIALLPDTLLMALTAALMLATLRLSAANGPTDTRGWLILGALLGLAGLSKYTAIFAAIASASVLLAFHGWRILANWRVVVAIMLAAILVLPVFVWNASHDWISFVYQAKHGAGGEWQARRIVVFLLVQLIVYGPLLGWSLYWQPWRAGKLAWLLGFFLLPFAIFGWMSGGGGSLPHWTAPAWVALAPFAGIGLARAWAAGRRVAIVVALALQSALCLAGFGLLFAGGIPWQKAGDAVASKNPIADLYGWDEAGSMARQLAKARGLDKLAVQNWTLASRLTWYAQPLPVHVLDDRFDQFDLWFGALPPGANVLLVDWSLMAYTLPVGAGGFSTCTRIADHTVMHWSRPLAQFDFYDCRDWHGGIPTQRKPSP